MEAIERAAFISVGRTFGFAGLAIFCIMFSFSFAPPLATFIGGLLCLATAALLFVQGVMARRRPYKRTETWMILPRQERPAPEIAQRVIGEVLRETYLRFTRDALMFAVGLLALSLLLRVIGFEELPLGERRSGTPPAVQAPPQTLAPAPATPWRWRVYP